VSYGLQSTRTIVGTRSVGVGGPNPTLAERPSPFRPAPGAAPPHFVDRSAEDEDEDGGLVGSSLEALRNGAADPRFHRVVSAAPGTGRTALLRQVARQAERRLGWSVVRLRCQTGEPVLASIGQRLSSLLARCSGGGGGAQPGDGGESRGIPGGAASRANLRSDLTSQGSPTLEEVDDLLQIIGWQLTRTTPGLLLVVDDVQMIPPPEQELLWCLLSSTSRSRMRVASLCAVTGSGQLPSSIWQSRMRLLNYDEVREALVVPAAGARAEFSSTAVDLIAVLAQGQPLDVQLLGDRAWKSSQGTYLIDEADVRKALQPSVDL
jgi:hypothetical protein